MLVKEKINFKNFKKNSLKRKNNFEKKKSFSLSELPTE